MPPKSPATLTISADLLICTNCGAQYDTPLDPSTASESTFMLASSPDCPLKSCRICDDPREFVPPVGQRFTTLGRLTRAEEGYRNVFETVREDEKVVEIWTEPKFGIGQGACLIRTPHGNVLWDIFAYLDQDTVDKINDFGGLEFIIVSHPHFYTTWADWAATFKCPVYMSSVDAKAWANRTSDPAVSSLLKLLTETHTTLLPGLTAIIAGGHFEGSMMLHSVPPNTMQSSMFVDDTIQCVASAQNPAVDPITGKPSPYFLRESDPHVGAGHENSNRGIVSYTFLYSIPNMIPLDANTVLQIWRSMKGFDFVATYGVYAQKEVIREGEGHREKGVMGLPERVLASMKVFVDRIGGEDHAIMSEAIR